VKDVFIPVFPIIVIVIFLSLFSWLCVFTELKTLDTELSWENFSFSLFFFRRWNLIFENFSHHLSRNEGSRFVSFLFSLFFSALHLRFSSSPWFFMMKKSRFNFIHHKMTLDSWLISLTFSLSSWKLCIKYIPSFQR
jgi:hypothetical protein